MAPTLHSLADLDAIGLVEATPALERVAERYAIGVTPDIVALIDATDPDDPIGRQFLPDVRELDVQPEERADPIGDGAHSPVKGIVHRYPDRVLLKPVHVCPVYCRFCFRREFVGPGSETLTEAELAAAIGYVRDHSEIWEVIVTGGDPLMLSPRRIAGIVGQLELDRACEGAALAQPGSDRRSLARFAGIGCRAGRINEVGVDGRPRQSSARVDRRRSGGVAAAGWRRRRAGQPDRAAQRRQ